MSARPIFDESAYQILNPPRALAIKDVLSELSVLGLKTSADVGCGLGYFSSLLHSLGLHVTGIEGRSENVEEARRRVPQVNFHTLNAEDPALRQLGSFDLVLCLGLLYHLENPFLAIRNLHGITSTILIVESVVFPGSEPIMALVDEGQSEDQGLNHIAFYPTEACLVKLLYQAGFSYVYCFTRMPQLMDYDAARSGGRRRTMLAASHEPLESGLLKFVPQPQPELIRRVWPTCDANPSVGTFRKLGPIKYVRRILKVK